MLVLISKCQTGTEQEEEGEEGGGLQDEAGEGEEEGLAEEMDPIKETIQVNFQVKVLVFQALQAQQINIQKAFQDPHWDMAGDKLYGVYFEVASKH